MGQCLGHFGDTTATNGNRGVNDPETGAGTQARAPAGVVHATVPRHHHSDPRPRRQKAPPGRAWRVDVQVVATIVLMSIRHSSPILRIAGRIIVIAFDASGLRTRKGVFPHVFPFLNPLNAWMDEPGQWGEMPI